MPRLTRSVSQSTREKIAAKLRGKPKSEMTKKRMSEAQKRYWSSIPQTENNELKPELQ